MIQANNLAMRFNRKTNQTILIDGGLGSTLLDYGVNVNNDPLWSGKSLVEQPDKLVAVHRAFVRAKADIIATCTYQVTTEKLMEQYAISHEKAEEIIMNGVTLAKKVIDEEKASCFAAASIGPYGAMLGDGSEFNGWYTNDMSIEQFKDWHRPRLALLTRAEPDLIAFETIPSQKEAEALVSLLREFPQTKAWLAFNCKDNKMTAHGELIEDAAASICQISPDQLIAVGMNCVHPENVLPLIERMKMKHIQRDFIVYPNAGATWNKEEKEFEGLGQSILSYIPSYLDARIPFIGGCCHVGPDQIRAIRDMIDHHSNKVTSD